GFLEHLRHDHSATDWLDPSGEGGGLVGAAGDSIDRLADDSVEAPSGRTVSASRSPIPPSRGTGVSKRSWAELRPRPVRSLRPDSTSKKWATMTDATGSARGSWRAGGGWTVSDLVGRRWRFAPGRRRASADCAPSRRQHWASR